jgi:hypothetical protein
MPPMMPPAIALPASAAARVTGPLATVAAINAVMKYRFTAKPPNSLPAKSTTAAGRREALFWTDAGGVTSARGGLIS